VPTATRPRRPQARGLATRARILRAAEELFTRGGYAGATIHDVAERAGVGVGTVYHHFPDKHALLLELIDDWGERLSARRRGDLDLERLLSDDPRASIERALRRALDRQRKEPSIYVVVLAHADRDDEVRRRYGRIEQTQIERLAEFVAFGQQRGTFRRAVDPDSAAFLIHHAIDMAATQLLVREVAHPSPDQILSELAEMICSYLLEKTR
jgi:AcrR family transcriptional regulator